MKRKMLLFTFALPLFLSPVVQAQSSSRLVGEAHSFWNATFLPSDSSSFSYSNGRGGDLSHPMMFDNGTTWNYDTAYHNQSYIVQTFDGNGNVTSRVTEFWNGSGWQLLTNTLFTYTTGNKMTTMIMQNWNGMAWAPVAQDVYSYDGAGRLVVDQYQMWNTSTVLFEAQSQKTYYYDVTGNRTSETDQDLTGVPVYTYHWAYTYSTSNQLLTNTQSTWNGLSWTPTNMTTNTYDTSGNMTNMLMQTYDLPTTSWINGSMDVYSTFNAAHLPMTDDHQLWNGGTSAWDNSMEFTNTYNSFNQLTSRTGKSWNIVGLYEFALGDPMTRYYYQTYNPNVAEVKNVSVNGGEAKVYPVPAQNTLNIDLTWNEAQASIATIYDAQGKVVRQWDVPSATEYHTSVSVNNLSEGVYFLQISGANGQIVKQIVIGH